LEKALDAQQHIADSSWLIANSGKTGRLNSQKGWKAISRNAGKREGCQALKLHSFHAFQPKVF
jgi:hypothetical protein